MQAGICSDQKAAEAMGMARKAEESATRYRKAAEEARQSEDRHGQLYSSYLKQAVVRSFTVVCSNLIILNLHPHSSAYVTSDSTVDCTACIACRSTSGITFDSC